MAKEAEQLGYNSVSYALERGKRARRRSWDPKAPEIYGQAPVIYCDGKPWMPSKEDQLAKDWVLL